MWNVYKFSTALTELYPKTGKMFPTHDMFKAPLPFSKQFEKDLVVGGKTEVTSYVPILG